jgi:hypothetical protein
VAVFRLTAERFLLGAMVGLLCYAVLAELVVGHVWPHGR